MKTFEECGINTRGKTSGEVKTLCPKCSADRKKSNDPCLSVNVDKGTWNCHNPGCNWSGGLGKVDRESFIPKKTFTRPPAPKSQIIAKSWMEWLCGRGITPEVIVRNRIFSSTSYLPQTQKDTSCINFPYYREGELINIKRRDQEKNFSQEKDAEQILYGYDDIQDDCLIWVEGEIDKLSMEVAGFKSVVSVPSGAPGTNDKNLSKKFEFLDSAKARLDLVKNHIIAVDSDGPGFRLQQELIRRLGAERCAVANWPDDCKDANDCLKKHGVLEVSNRVKSAKQCPIKGIVTIDDISQDLFSLYEHGQEKGLSTGWGCVDEYYTVRAGEFTVITGIPGHGKSEWLDALMLNLAHGNGWKFALFSPENQPLREHAKKLVEKVVDKPFFDGPSDRMTPGELVQGAEWLSDKFCFVVPENPIISEILDAGKKMVRRWGINGMVIDPWNEIDHSRPSSMTETEYVSHSISLFRRFARENMIHLWVVAHPTKLPKDIRTGKYPPPTLYDISGSAHWRNKADNGICVFRPNMESNDPIEVHIQKVRFKAVGKVGIVKLLYNRVTGRYRDPSTNFSNSFIGG